MTQQHPDPINEGLIHSGQRIVQIVTLAVGAKEAWDRRRSRLKLAEQSAEIHARRAALAEARSRWSLAHDRKWLHQANLIDVAEAWGAAVPYAAENASAASAVGKCEERLRELHPHAMSHYDRFRAENKDPLAAMREAAPYFDRDPNIRTGEPAAPRKELHEGAGDRWAATVHGPDRGEWEEARQEQRGRQIADDLRTRLQAQGREPEPQELRTVLEVTTNLPEHIIARAVPAPAGPSRHHRTTDTGPAAEDFPLPIDQALAMTANQPFPSASARRSEAPSPDRNRRRNL
ncbi:hypothetical protein [Actinomadura sp. WMMB 499]|uniref:hypothetical protein n=1 Tax=Actinomadura sp. WMMB 499 TaxID=1219491 RepID=UPI001244953C|nr:hypothetical protein [Actinomadura sp. WMMB 499]QFG22891.1 hypothetical protein F7P10_19000 [Actinomadura sp. WMMB 499]